MSVDSAPTVESVDSARTTEADAAVFADRLFGAALGAMEVQAVYLGDRLGWYRALAAHGPLTSTELAERTGCAERYAREWLEHQAVAGYLSVEDPAEAPAEAPTEAAVARRYHLPAAHAEVLTDVDSLVYLAPLARFIVGAGRHVDALREAYRTGGGVSWAALGEDLREAQGAMNRPLFLHQLGQEYLPQIPGLAQRLGRAGARVADVGCGVGWSAIAIARAYPGVTVDGFDLDPPSVEAARRNAAEAGVADRVHFAVADIGQVQAGQAQAGQAQAGRRYDAVFAFECLHDMPDPVGVLTAMRGLAGPDGIVIVMDERTEDRFTAPGSEVERLLYGYSLICCLPDGMSQQPSAATGTVMRADTLIGYATRAGFSRVETLPLNHDFFRFYQLHS
ncbi:MAG TPA: class I SAM-dependent methyltransferase [Pseudonocardiaceae bacterium]|nr:class I SAM-dependent methyltransferase [Pseudonocardiaceae bacterium]